MQTFSFYQDAKGREYYLPSKTIEAYRRDSRPHVLPQGCKKVKSADGRTLYILNNFSYPPSIQGLLKQFHQVAYFKSAADLRGLKCSHIAVDFAGLPSDILKLIFSYIPKASLCDLTALFFTCKRFRANLKEKPELQEVCVKALGEGNLKMLAWAKKYGLPFPYYALSIEAAEWCDIKALAWLYRQQGELDANVYTLLLTSIKNESVSIRLEATRWVLSIPSEHRKSFKEKMAEFAVKQDEPELLRLTAYPGMATCFDTLHYLAVNGHLDILKVIIPHEKNIYNSLNQILLNILTASVVGERKAVFDWAVYRSEKMLEKSEMNDFFNQFLSSANNFCVYERAKNWIFEKGYRISPPYKFS